MPTLRKPSPLAVLCSDLHICSLQPSARADKDWFAVQRRYLSQLCSAALDFSSSAEPLPIVCAGDIFDRWNPNPETINFALKYLPNGMFCVPGQHDLPNHRLDQTFRSGYGTLMEAGKIVDISGGNFVVPSFPELEIQGFAWGQDIAMRAERPSNATIKLAVIHKYCWIEGKSYPGAPEGNTPKAMSKMLRGFDAAVFGDNHKGFMAKAGLCNIINTGGFIRRKTDEFDYNPQIGILYDDGSICTCPLDISKDEFHDIADKRAELPVNMADFIQGLEDLGEHGLNFKEAVINHLRDSEYSTRTKEIIHHALEC